MKKQGFTLIELLVVIAIIALLLAIVMPALKKVKESAGLLVCKTNLRSIHAGMILYAEGNKGKVSDPRGDTTTSPDPRPNTPVDWRGNAYERWCRKWYLRLYDYLETPKVYVCPAWRKRDGEAFIAYTVGSETYYVTYTGSEYILSLRDREPTSGGIRPARDWKYAELVSKSVANNPISLFLSDGIYEVNGWGDWRAIEMFNYTPGTLPAGGRASYRHGGKANFLCTDGRIGSLEMQEVHSWPSNGRYEDFRPLVLK
jgi:prepilin-type N-terminal cleavage/methylation domain-containing protein